MNDLPHNSEYLHSFLARAMNFFDGVEDWCALTDIPLVKHTAKALKKEAMGISKMIPRTEMTKPAPEAEDCSDLI